MAGFSAAKLPGSWADKSYGCLYRKGGKCVGNGRGRQRSCRYKNSEASNTDSDDTVPQGHRPATRVQPAWMRNDSFLVGDELYEHLELAMSAESVGAEPKTVQEALRSPQAKLWQDSMEAEYDSLMKNGVFKLVKLPNGRDVLGVQDKTQFRW